jgi:Family of unknown function (DUF6459)
MTTPEARSPLPFRRPAPPVGPRASVTQLCPQGVAPAPVAIASVQGTLALDLRLVPTAPTTPELSVVPGEPAPDQHELRAWAARFAQATVEVLGGDRPVSQLLRWTTKRVYHDLDRRVRILGRTAATPQRVRTQRPQVRSVHVYQPAPDAAEVSVHVRHGHRSRAIAARLEHRDGRWRCAALELG